MLLVAYDAPYPEPLRSTRPIPDAFAVALVLAPARKAAALARLEVRLSDAPADQLPDAGFEALRQQIPAARSLPLLVQLARRGSGTVVLDYLKPRTVSVELQTWP